MSVKVIDLSHWNKVSPDLKPAYADGVRGVIHKATEGTGSLDEKCAARYSLAKEAGMLWGLYHFMRPGSPSVQVSHFLTAIQNVVDVDTLLALDFEVDEGVTLADVKAFLSELQTRTNRSPVIYSGNTLKEALGGTPDPELSKYRLWLADYTPPENLPPGFDSAWLWQNTDKATVPGISDPCDMSTFDGTEEDLKREWAGHMTISAQPVPVADKFIGLTLSVPPDVPVYIWMNGILVLDGAKGAPT